MKVCKVKPDKSECSFCLDMQYKLDKIENCNKCSFNNREYELITVTDSFWGSKAIVQYEGKLKTVLLDRVYNIREKE